MALIGEIKDVVKTRQQVHGRVDCSASMFEDRGERYLQLDTYGSPSRAFAGKTSQTIQFDRDAAEQMLHRIKRAFPELR